MEATEFATEFGAWAQPVPLAPLRMQTLPLRGALRTWVAMTSVPLLARVLLRGNRGVRLRLAGGPERFSCATALLYSPRRSSGGAALWEFDHSSGAAIKLRGP